MQSTQKQTLESFVRIRTFLDAHPAKGPLTYHTALVMFDEALRNFRAHATTRSASRALRRAAERDQRELCVQLRDRYMRPILTIARAQIAPGVAAGLPAAFRLPNVRTPVTRLLQACDGMLDVARQFEPVLIEQGLPEDFLDQFAQARDALQAVTARRSTLASENVTARTGMAVELRRARLAVDRLDAVVRVAFEGDETVLAGWNAMKRVQGSTRGVVSRPVGDDATEALDAAA